MTMDSRQREILLAIAAVIRTIHATQRIAHALTDTGTLRIPLNQPVTRTMQDTQQIDKKTQYNLNVLHTNP